MRMPPTGLFSITIEYDDMQIIADEDGEKIAIILDADSLLSQAARNLPATLLAWHYRSRSEALINFSNAAFYDGRLVTIPDRNVTKRESAQISVRSQDDGPPTCAVKPILNHPLHSPHFAI